MGDLSGADPVSAIAEVGASEADVIALGRTNAGFDALFAENSDAIFDAGHALEVMAVAAAAEDQGIPLPTTEPVPLESTCVTSASIKQAAKIAQDQVWAGSAFLALGELAVLLQVDVPPGTFDFPSLDGDKQIGNLSSHQHQTTSLSFSSEGSSVTVSVSLGLQLDVTDAAGGLLASTSETASTVVTLDYCPDASGAVKGTIDIKADGLGSDASFYDAQFSDNINLLVDDSANIIQVKTDGSGQYKSSGSGNISISNTADASAELENFTIDASTYEIAASSGDNLDASKSAALRFISASQYSGMLAALVVRDGASKKFRNGKCVSLKVTPGDEMVDANASVSVSATVHHQIENQDLPLPVVATLSGPSSLAPMGMPVPSPASFNYVAGSMPGQAGTLSLISTSKRGIAKASVTYTVQKGPCDFGPDNCPDGSSWDATSSTCVATCVPGGTIAGYACVYAGTATATSVNGDGAVGPSETANVTLTATGLDGCAIAYVPTGTATYTPPPGDGCSYSPTSVSIGSSNTFGTFTIGLSPPTLIPDYATFINGMVTCGKGTIASQYGMVWIETLGSPAPQGGPLSGTGTIQSPSGSVTSTWMFMPQ